MRFFKKKPAPLGHLEECVMEILWSGGECNVRDVAEKLARPLAYTTVMTTLDRLYKKGLLERRKSDRAFLYAPRLSRLEWDRKLIAGFSDELLISCFLDNASRDPELLDELELRIRMKRKEMRKS